METWERWRYAPTKRPFRSQAHSALASAAGAGRRANRAPSAHHTARASPFYEWKAAILNEPRTLSGWPLFSRARSTSRVGGAEAGSGLRCERSRCQILRRGRRQQRMCSFTSFRRDPPAQPHPGIGFPVGESRTTRIPPTFLL